MHITDSNLVGGKINVINAENGQKILVIEDTDNTTGIPYQNYRFIQSKALTEICVAIHPYGAVIISTKTNEMVEQMGTDLSKYHLQVKFGGNIYWIDLASLLALESGDDVTFVPMPSDASDGENLDEELPPYSASEAGKYLKVNADGDGIEWADVPSELPEIEAGDGGKVLKVKADETGTEWGDLPDELPAIASGDAGKVLKVNDDETGVEWRTSGSANTIGYPTIFLERRQSKAWGATNGELYAALDDYNSNNYLVNIEAGETNRKMVIPLSASFSSGHPSSLKGAGMNYSLINGTTLTIKIFEITVTIDNNIPDQNPNLTITETTKTITLDS